MIHLTTISPCLLNLLVKELICNQNRIRQAMLAKEERNMLPIQMPLSTAYGIQQNPQIANQTP